MITKILFTIVLFGILLVIFARLYWIKFISHAIDKCLESKTEEEIEEMYKASIDYSESYNTFNRL